ncbi:alpha-galactosidase [Acutalibacter intestini]|uniref:alpha-galactosidase n=1 Tax=Acutalibacter intestini TaxID=3093659 RepID=UPI002AC94393|nr:alpha-galactosidase [Acutalibacter sp. M00204]
MPITFDEKNKVFRLDTKTSSYAMMVFEENYLIHLYYGPKIPDTDLQYLMYRGWYESMSPHNPKVSEHRFTLDAMPQEYSGNQNGDFRLSALQVRNHNGDAVTDLRYVGHKIYPGKPQLPGLPATFAGEGQAETLEIETLDAVTGVKATLLYTVFENHGAMARSVRLENTGSAPVDLERAFSLCLDLPGMNYDLVHMYGRWAKENTVVRHPLQHGIQAIGSKRGMTSSNHNPFAALCRQGSTEEQGQVMGVSLVYSGNFSIEIEVDTLGCPRLLAGINPTDFCWRLEPGESFTTPEAVMVFSEEGLGGMSRDFHRLYMDHLCRSEWTHKKRPVLINDWEAAVFDFDDELLVAFAKEAKDLGVEMLVMDDGWFGTRNDDRQGLGDWYVNENKLKGGLGSLIQRVNDLGLKFGIWYEPEMVNPNSDLYRAHPDWIIQAQGREGSLSRYQCVLDMTRKEVRDNIFQQMYDVISKNNIAYIKWDCNRNISEAGNAVLPPERQGEFFHRYVLGVYELMDRVTRAFPHILLENCSSGGCRFDPGMLYYSPQIWTSDNTDPIERLTIQFGASLCYPVASMGAHVSACPRTGFETRGAVALMGTFGYELDPRKLTEEQKNLAKAQIADYHKYYDLIHYGDLYRLTDPAQDRFFADWEFVSPDQSEALLTRVVMRKPDNFYQMLRLRGLDPHKTYMDQATGQRYSGALLMNAGVDLSTPYPGPADGSCVMKHFIQV